MARIVERNVPESPNGKPVVTPETRAEWRRWLAANTDRTEGLWVVYRKKSSSLEGPIYEHLVEEALCFGWIDSQERRVDDDRVMQWFSPRRPGGVWSAPNKERVERLERQGLMTEAGLRVIEQARADGSWSQMDEVDSMIVPGDMADVLAKAPGAREAYEALADANKKQLLWAVYSAKRAETRARRIEQILRDLS
ncbi:MAG: YdeI/OmpD-associated family protein [Actinobacteria bacterium]|nr:YdeI/OmpD-associated family protein [Actinomycetota bacterium]